MKLGRTLLSLLLAVSFAFPSCSLAQSSNQINSTNLPLQMQAYLNQPQEIVQARALQLPLLLMQTDRTDGFDDLLVRMLVAAVGGYTLYFGYWFVRGFNNKLFSLSEWSIVHDDEWLEAYVEKRYESERIKNGVSKRGKNSPIIQHFENLNRFFGQIEDGVEFSLPGAQTTPVKNFYALFNRFGNELAQDEVRDVIRCLVQTPDPKVYLAQTHYTNLVHAIRVFGPDDAYDMVKHLTPEAFHTSNYKTKVEEPMLERLRNTPSETTDAAILKAVPDRNLHRTTLDVTAFVNTLDQKKSFLDGKSKTAGRIAIMAAAVAAIVYVIRKLYETAVETSSLDQNNLEIDEALALANDDPEAYQHFVRTDQFMAVVGAWLYDQVVQAKRDLVFFRQETNSNK